MGLLSRIEINLSAIEHNLGVIESVLASHPESGEASLCAVLKADAYGMGARRIARRIAARVAMIAVYSLDQARDLVESGVGAQILVLMPVHGLDRRDALYGAAVRGQLHLSIHDNATLDALIDVANGMGLRLPVHVEVDTGLGRCGSTGEEALVLVRRIAKHARLRLAGVYSHCSSSDTDRALTESQGAMLDEWIARAGDLIPRDALIHQASTFGVFRGDRYHRSMVRVGLAMFGYAREEFGAEGEFEHARDAHALRPALRWVSRICQSRWLEAGAKVGYGGVWTAARRTRTAIVPVGYADGYPLGLSNNARVGVLGENGIRGFAPVLGRVSMDQIVIDTTDLPDAMSSVGTEVELVGIDPAAPNHLPALAHRAGLISHAFMCGIGPRVPRSYVTDASHEDPIVPAVAVRTGTRPGRTARAVG